MARERTGSSIFLTISKRVALYNNEIFEDVGPSTMESHCLRRWSGTYGECGKSTRGVFTLWRNCRCFPPVSAPISNFILKFSLMYYRKPDGPNSTELHRGFGYVEFEDPEDIKDAIDNMEGAELFGKVLKVSAAKPPKNVNEGLGSKTALWEQVSGNGLVNIMILSLF